MSFFDIFAMAVRNLFKRRVRTALTLGGVIIGTAAITIMMSLGIAVNMSFQAQIEAIGHEALRIEIWSNTWDPMNRRTIEMRDVEAVSRLPNVAAATPFLETNLTFLSGRYLASIWVTGILPEAMDAMGIEIAEGRMLDSTDGFALVMGSQIPYEFRTAREMERNRGGFGGGGVMIAGRGGGFTVISPGGMGMGGGIDRTRNVDVLSARFQASFVHGFGNPNAPAPTGPRVIPYQVDVVGVLGGDNWQAQRTSYMPLDQVIQVIEDRVAHERRQGNTNPWNPLEDGFQNMHIFATEVRYVDGIVEELEAMGFTNVFTQLSWINHLRESNASLETLLSAIGAVSLFIAAIGITNTMVMAIYERTREIGVMKVIGASIRDIRRLFLIEAAMFGAIGGAIGLAVSMGISHWLNTSDLTFFQATQHIYGAVVSHIPLWLYGLGFGFSCAIGLLSGFLPARRATKISALSAIRTE